MGTSGQGRSLRVSAEAQDEEDAYGEETMRKGVMRDSRRAGAQERIKDQPIHSLHLSPAASFVACLFLLTCLMGAADRAIPKPTAKDKCPVCGMFVAKYPDWTTVILFKDGSQLFFDGAKDMFKYLHDPKRYDPARNAREIETVMVMEYYGLEWMDARKAVYVIGSDVYGPMGKECIPLEKDADAREFMNDHKGMKILRFSEVTAEVIRALE
jgi:copper chaperone NosL